jgi:hypothetical protein
MLHKSSGRDGFQELQQVTTALPERLLSVPLVLMRSFGGAQVYEKKEPFLWDPDLPREDGTLLSSLLARAAALHRDAAS